MKRQFREAKLKQSKYFLNIRWLGHAGFRVGFSDPDKEEQERVVYIDAWLQNPKLPEDYKDKVPDDADLVLVTHGHFDHAGSAADIVKGSKKAHVKVASNFEICQHFINRQGVEESKAEMMNKGGNVDLEWCQISLTYADHSSCCVSPEG